MVRAKNPAFRLFVDEFLNGTRHFTAKEVGIYILFLCEQWDQGILPKDEKELCKIGRCSREGMQKVIKKFKFSEEFGGFFNEKLKKEKEASDKFFEKNRLNGKKGGRPKTVDNKEDSTTGEKPNGLVSVKPNETETVTQTEPTNNHTSTSTSTSNIKREGETTVPPTPPQVDSDGSTEMPNDPPSSPPNNPKTQKNKAATRTVFVKPTPDQVVEYFKSYTGKAWTLEKVQLEAGKWYDYYEGNGWRVGKNPMKVWEAVVRGWVQRDPGYNGSAHTAKEQHGGQLPSHTEILNKYK